MMHTITIKNKTVYFDGKQITTNCPVVYELNCYYEFALASYYPFRCKFTLPREHVNPILICTAPDIIITNKYIKPMAYSKMVIKSIKINKEYLDLLKKKEYTFKCKENSVIVLDIKESLK